MSNRTVHFTDLGLKEYKETWDYQEQLFNASQEIKQNIGLTSPPPPTPNYLIFCEHPHVFTLGKSGSENNLLINLIQLKAKNAVFFKTNRGGDITYHGPGQIVGYPILDLENFSLGIKSYIDYLEEVIILTLKEFEITSERLAGATGVWIDSNKPSARKICAIGVRASRYITMHGFALNVNTDLSYFSHINPCGFTDKTVTSMQKELGRDIPLDEVKKSLKNNFEDVFKMKLIN
ncbi:MAG: lipoyl(octanoyl) transferase LipB [Bacteroidota bacterium]